MFWERVKLFSWKVMSSFKWPSSWEGPTWSALSLIFNWSDSTIIGPVDFSWKIISWCLFTCAFSCVFKIGIESKIFSGELLVGQISIEIHLKVICLKTSIESSIVLSNILEVFKPDLESIWVFDRIILFIHFLFPDFKHKILVWLSIGFQIKETNSSYSYQSDKK